MKSLDSSESAAGDVLGKIAWPGALLVSIVMVVLVAVVGGSRSSEAAPGDLLRTFTLPASQNCANTWSTGLAFDGTALLRSCWFSGTIQRIDPANGAVLTPVAVSNLKDIGALSWDTTRQKLWACSGGHNVYLVDVSTLVASFMFPVNSCASGLSRDPVDDTIWASCEACANIDHYTSAGTLIKTFTAVQSKIGNQRASGLAVQGTNLYVSNSDGQQIYRCTKDMVTCTLLATFSTNHRIEDLECDDASFPGKAAIWVQDSFTLTLGAYEAPPGTCSGAAAPPTSTASPSPSATSTLTPAAPTSTPSPSPSATSTSTPLPATSTASPGPSATSVSTLTPVATSTGTATAIATGTNTPSATSTACAACSSPTNTPTPTRTKTPPASPTRAGTGSIVRQFNASVSACANVWSTGLAFDGTALLRSCWFSNVIQRISPVDGSALPPLTISGVADLASLAWDSRRSVLWACSAQTSLYRIDTAAQVATKMPFRLSGACIDGLSYDPTDDTLWAGCDACDFLDHYTMLGVLIKHFIGVSTKLGARGRSGIAVQGNNLYLSNSSGEQIYQCTKTLSTCNVVGKIASTHRMEDLECDDVTFAPRTVVWTQDDFTTTFWAFQVADGTCVGLPAATSTPSSTPTVAATDTPTASTTTPPDSATPSAPTVTPSATMTYTPTPADASTSTPSTIGTSTATPAAVPTAPDTPTSVPAATDTPTATTM